MLYKAHCMVAFFKTCEISIMWNWQTRVQSLKNVKFLIMKVADWVASFEKKKTTVKYSLMWNWITGGGGGGVKTVKYSLLWNLQTRVASFSLSANSVSSRGMSTVGGRNMEDFPVWDFGRTENIRENAHTENRCQSCLVD